MTTITKTLARMYGYSRDVYASLLRCSLYTNIIMSSDLSLTLCNRILSNIVNTRNNKYRRKYIQELHEYLNSHTKLCQRNVYFTPVVYGDNETTVLKHVCNVLDVHNEALKPHDLPYDCKLRNIDNSPWYTAVTASDSKHYTSCLRSGIVDVADSTTELDWINTYARVHEHPAQGCNYAEYIDAEVHAFKHKHIVYLTAGTGVHEKAEGRYGCGYTARIRVHVVSKGRESQVPYDDSTATFLVDRYYGGPMHVVNALVQQLLDTYPGRVYLVSSLRYNYPNIVTGDDSVEFYMNKNTYTDYSPVGVRILCVDNSRNIYSIKQRQHSWLVQTLKDTVRIRRASAFDWYTPELTNKLRAYLEYHAHGRSMNTVTSYVGAELRSLAIFLGVRVHDYNEHYAEVVIDNSKVYVDYNTIMWCYGMFTYSIVLVNKPACIFTRTNIKTDRRSTLNWVTGKFDNGVLESSTHHNIPRQRILTLLKFMPKSWRERGCNTLNTLRALHVNANARPSQCTPTMSGVTHVDTTAESTLF